MNNTTTTTTTNTYVNKVSMGNSKIGLCLNANLPVVITCRENAPCASSGCYAKKGCYNFKSVRNLYHNNLMSYMTDPDMYFQRIDDALNGGSVIFKYFRWHSSGDIVDSKYLDGMCELAKKNAVTTFLCYTKKYELVLEYAKGHEIPSNLTIIFSMWRDCGLEFRNSGFPIAYVKFANDEDGFNAMIPENAFMCPGACEKCHYCWHMKSEHNVYFNEH